MKKYVLFMLLLIMSVPATYAQPDDIPLIATLYEDDGIYQIENGAYVPICETGESRTMKSAASSSNVFRVSPDGRNLVFHTWANGEPDPNEFPNPTEPFYTNTWICSLVTGEVEQIYRENDAFQSLPVFSPEGDKIVWSETTGENEHVRVVAYDLTTGETSLIMEFEADMIRQSVPFLDWGEPGIAISGIVNRGETSEKQLVIMVGPPEQDGDALFTYDEPLNSTLRAEWVDFDGTPRLMLRGFDIEENGIALISEDFNAVEFLPSIASVENAHRNSEQFIINSRDVFGGTLESNPDNPVVQFTFSPDGGQVAYVRADNYPNGGDLYVGSAFVSAITDEFDLVGDETDADTPGVQAIAWGAPQPVILGATMTGEPEPIEMTVFVSPNEWMTQVPAGWQENQGTFSGDDNTQLVIGGGSGFTVEDVVTSVIGTPVESSGTVHDTPSGEWSLYQYDYLKQDTETDVRIIMGVTQIDNRVYSIILQSPQAESAMLQGHVFFPAIYNFRLVETFEAQPPVGGVPAGEETTITGTVTGTVDDCAFDGICALVLDTSAGEINAVWAEGMVRCEGSYAGDAAIGDVVEVYGVVRDSSSLSICPSPDYYIRQASAS